MKFKINKGAELGDFFYQKEKVVYGPFKKNDLIKLIDRNSMVYKQGAEWGRAKDNIELKDYFIQYASNSSQGSNPNSTSTIEATAVANPLPLQENQSKKSPWLFVVIVLVLLAGGILFFLSKNNNPFSDNITTDSTANAMPAADTTSLSGEDAVYQMLSTRNIEESQMQGATFQEIVQYSNELLARHGFIFDDPILKGYYTSKPWYKPENSYLMATSGFSVTEKYNYDILNNKLIATQNNISEIIHRYYNSFIDETFDANNFYAQTVDQYISKKNITPIEVNNLYNSEKSDFLNPKFQFIEPLELKYLNSISGVDYFLFKVFYGVYRPSRNKYESCGINVKIGFNKSLQIAHYEETSLENLKFSDTDNFANDISGSESTWVVILGSFRTESEADNVVYEYTNSGIETEVLNTNSFQYLEKDYYIVCAGRQMSQMDASQLVNTIKSKGYQAYLKNAGVMQ
jgi:hypothetical protein